MIIDVAGAGVRRDSSHGSHPFSVLRRAKGSRERIEELNRSSWLEFRLYAEAGIDGSSARLGLFRIFGRTLF